MNTTADQCRIESTFSKLAETNTAAFVAYVTAGDPSMDKCLGIIRGIADAGADVIELGVPFSDPMAEGPVIQLAHERALANGISLRKTLETVRQFRQQDKDTPVLLMGYANPVEHMGYAVFADAAASAGVDALLTVDIPPEEVGAVNAELNRVGLDNIFLIAPNTPQSRIDTIAEQASGFIYYVSLKGVTGAGNLDTEEVARRAQLIRSHTDLPLAVGFGIKDAESAKAVAAVADGVVVGSALINVMAAAMESGGTSEAAIAAAKSLLGDIRTGIDSLS